MRVRTREILGFCLGKRVGGKAVNGDTEKKFPVQGEHKKFPVQGEHKENTAGRDWLSRSRIKRQVLPQRKPPMPRARKGADGNKEGSGGGGKGGQGATRRGR